MVLHHSKAVSDNERMLSALGGEGGRVMRIYYGTFSKLSPGFSSRMAVEIERAIEREHPFFSVDRARTPMFLCR